MKLILMQSVIQNIYNIILTIDTEGIKLFHNGPWILTFWDPV